MPGKTEKIELKVGDKHLLVLPGKSMAGFQWQFEIDHPKALEIKKKVSRTKPGDRVAAGAELPEEFILKANEKGTVLLIFTQSREWEKGKKPASVKKYEVKIV